MKFKLVFISLLTFLYYFNNFFSTILFEFNKTAAYSKLINSFYNETNISLFLKCDISNINCLIDKLKLFRNQSKQTNIIFSDYFISKCCYDKSAFYIFQYYLRNNLYIPYYIINENSDFYKSLLIQNKTKNLILYNDKNLTLFYLNLYEILKDSKIIINAYSIEIFQLIVINVPYIKFLKINHGIKYFKVLYAQTEFKKELGAKMNVICSSPYEYELYTKELKYNPNQIHNASLSRYERFQYIQKNNFEKNCILVSFTYRAYNKEMFDKSIYKNNLKNFLNNENLIISLINNNIDLIYIPHHEEIDLGKNYSQYDYKYAQIKNQSKLEHFIEQCSLLVTDFSSISFDFMFQNKPVLFYSIDKDDSNNIIEKKFMRESNDTIYFGNFYNNKDLLVDKIKYYINNNFSINSYLKQKYESVFFLKTNIFKRLEEIINNILINK